MLLICTASSGKNRALADRLHELAAEAFYEPETRTTSKTRKPQTNKKEAK